MQALPLAAAENETVQYFTLDKASAAHLQDSLDSCDSCSKKIYSRMNYIMLTTNLPNPTNIYHVVNKKIRLIRAISVRKNIFAYELYYVDH